MLDQSEIEALLTFLGRADLKGVEVAAFVNLTNKLNAMRAKIVAGEVQAKQPE